MNTKELILDLCAFAGTVLCVIAFKWDVADIIWGLWICSFCVGYAYILTAIIEPALRERGKDRFARLGIGLFMIGFFTIHFGMFHYVHASFLVGFFPLDGVDTRCSMPALLRTTIPLYWPMILTTFVSRFSYFPLGIQSSARGIGRNMGHVLTKPYANVIRMHLLIFVFAGLNAAGKTGWAVYPVLAAYFFPWGQMRKVLRQRRGSARALDDAV
ncbi:MAG: DUF6498-containing protein [Kiritimatiellae bacterium]|nr:DUF6498-containing protein [Kiritimatiellia bacterium]